MDLGEYTACLNVQDLERSIRFYEKLGFGMVEDQRQENWAILKHNNLILSLYQGHIQQNLINFRGGDIEAIATEIADQGIDFSMPATMHTDGSWSAEVCDPDGNKIFLNTFTAEREKYISTGKLMADDSRG